MGSIIFFNAFSCSSVGVDVLGDPKKSIKQTDSRGRLSLQGFVIPPIAFFCFPYFSFKKEKYAKENKTWKECSLFCFLLVLFFRERRGRAKEKDERKKRKSRTPVPRRRSAVPLGFITFGIQIRLGKKSGITGSQSRDLTANGSVLWGEGVSEDVSFQVAPKRGINFLRYRGSEGSRTLANSGRPDPER